MELYCVVGEWKCIGETEWRFFVDQSKTALTFEICDSVSYLELMEMVREDFELQNQEFSVTYGLSLCMKSSFEDSPPVSIKNDRHLKSFINKMKKYSGISRLCVKVSDNMSLLPADNVGSNIQPSRGSNITQGEEQPLTLNEDPGLSADRGESSVRLKPLPDIAPVHIGLGLSPSTREADDIYVNRYFKNKAELMLRTRQWALEWKFEFLSWWSDKKRVILGCVDKACSWKMHAKKLPTSDLFVVKKYVHGHTCGTTHRHTNHRQATAEVLGNLICSNYAEKKDGLKPKQIIEQARIQHGVQITYKQAWRVKEKAQNLIRGTPKDSYYNLGKWLCRVKEKNPGSLSYILKDDAEKFKYAFVAFGQSIRGFAHMRRVVAVDGTFLKSKFKRTLLADSAKDGNSQLYPLAFAIVDSENEDAWTWFFRGLSYMIPNSKDLVFVSDRAPSIASAISTVYPLSFHGICRIHFLNNVKIMFRRTGFVPLVELAANAYTYHEFNKILNEIKSSSPSLAKYLQEADFRKWTRCHAPENRYNIMTTNIAESFNSMLAQPRELPVISIFESIRMTLISWFYDRREAAAKNDHVVTPHVVKKLLLRYDAAMKLSVYQIDRSEFEVKDECNKYTVNLDVKDCSCNVFDVDKIPCTHALASAKRSKRDEYQFVDPLYSTETWLKAYSESIHPCGDLTIGPYPENIDEYCCMPPATKRAVDDLLQSGRDLLVSLVFLGPNHSHIGAAHVALEDTTRLPAAGLYDDVSPLS